MKQVVFTAPGQIKEKDVSLPKIGCEEVLLKVAYIGVCGSDIQMYHGRHKYMTYPVVPGHEAGATVAKLGRGVTGYSVGEKVAIEPQIFCGECYPCTMGRFNVCENLRVMGVHANGFAQEYVALHQKYLHPCPANMSMESITMVEPLAVAAGAVKRATYKNANIAIIGAGTIGNLIAQAAIALGAGQVLISDMVQSRLDFAKDCGIQNTANLRETTLKEAIDVAFGHRKADTIIDAAATLGSFKSAIQSARPSSSIIITSNYKDPVELEMPLLQRREVNLVGHMMYVREDFADAIRLINEGKVNVNKLLTQTFELGELGRAFTFIEENPAAVMKVMMRI